MSRFTISLALTLAAATPLAAQDATIIYRLGKDTVAVEQFSRTPSRLSGEMVTRSGAAVSRTQYDFTLANGRPTAAVLRRRQPDGSPVPNAPTETRFTFGRDSVK